MTGRDSVDGPSPWLLTMIQLGFCTVLLYVMNNGMNCCRLHPDEFYKQLITHCEDMLPYLYTPTVGEACQKYHRLPVPTYGVYIRTSDRGKMLEKLQSLPDEYQQTKVVVVTDGERILGLGDLGAGGMGISEGKSLLYTAAAGVDPKEILPVCLDVGTGNEDLLNDEEYFGLKEKRLDGEEYHEFVEEFISALQAWRPHVVLQFEDFANHMAFDLLQKYRNRLCCFNDDIQGTASITLAGLLAALRVTGKNLLEQRVLFLGAGEAGTGIGELIAQGLSVWHGVPLEEGRKHCFFIDSKGLITRHRTNLQEHKMPFAHDIEPCSTLIESIRMVKPTVLVGVSTQRGAFTKEALELMAAMNERPIVFALSNPTSKSECTYEDAFNATDGRVLFASGSPFPTLHAHGKTYHPAQSNNAYIFPAVGHAAVLCQSSKITDEAFLIAADALASMATEEELACGRLFPRFSRIRSVSRQLMGVVAHHMVETGAGKKPDDFDAVTSNVSGDVQKWEAYAAKQMYQPVHHPMAVGSPRL